MSIDTNNYKTIFWFIIFFYILPVSGKNVYVAKYGNDNNDGSFDYPFMTIERALQETKNETDSLYIHIREGIYSFNSSLLLKNQRNIILRAHDDESVSISGGISIDKEQVRHVKESKILSRLKKRKKKYIRYIDLKSLPIKPEGLSKRGFAYKTKPAWTELFIDGKPLQLSRWPNEEMILIDSVINSGNIPSKNIKGRGKPIITYKETEPKKWKTVKGAWICGYFGEGWADDMLPIDSIDKVNKTLTIGSSSNYGFKADGVYRRWYVRNLPEEIDNPGEYYFDENTSKIYFLPFNNNINKIQISVLEKPIISIDSCLNIRIENITIECSRGTGVLIDASQNITIDNCTIRNIGTLGVNITHSSSCCGIQNSYIYQTGAGGVELNGGNRMNLSAANNFVNNCKIFDFNRIERSYRPGIHLKGVGNKISNTEIFDAPSMAIYLHGNNHIIEYVDIHHVCKEVHDQGAIYYGRNPTERGHRISFSYFHDIQSPFDVTAIYHDDGACGMEVHGCIFNNISSAPVLIGGGQDITYTNNIFMNLPYAIQIDNRLQIWQSYSKWLEPNGEYDTKFKAVNYTQPPYSTAYPELLEYWENNPALPKRNIITNNIFYNVDHLVKGNPAFLVLKDNFETKNNPGFKDIESPMKGLNYKSIRNNLPNFTPIPFEEIGCSLPIIQ